ncbi:hypothetical protein C8R45DRAFT_1090471 [Mycena sanguinolenta]|nr:hypothetical protein C8R45DRAFT_1090471 [Mycena sanguinolenta]
MVRTFTFFIAVLAASCISAAPLDARKKVHHKAGTAAAQGGREDQNALSTLQQNAGGDF